MKTRANIWTLCFLLLPGMAHAQTASPKFLGSQSCSSTGCHGGATENRHQYTLWSQKDFHHERPYATLTTARAERLAAVLKIGDATKSTRCTVCHAPFQTLPAERFAGWGESPDEPEFVKDDGSRGRSPHLRKLISEGVSCESCHGPAENWIRSHTRPDYTHKDRVNSGMRDLKNLHVRANTCIACHQNLDADILAAGHPELIFELDGQCVSQPKHWRESTNWNGAQAWLVGQAVALREMIWQLESNANANQSSQQSALAWLLKQAGLESPQQADAFVQTALARTWTIEQTRTLLAKFSRTADAFTDVSVASNLHARRAERLVLALDRLVNALPEFDKDEAVQSALKQLFHDVQSLPDFNPQQFTEHLKGFQTSVSRLESK